MKKGLPSNRPATPRWEFEPHVPTYDFLEEMSLDNTWDLQETVDNFVFSLEQKSFLIWEAVACHEQGLPLTTEQKDQLDDLINFGDPNDEQILYIDENPRTSQPWHVILNKIVPHLLIEPFVTSTVPDEVILEGWNQIVRALRKHGRGLSVPPGASSPEEVVPSELRHKLWLQFCFDPLCGLGQNSALTLHDEAEHHRIDDFIELMRIHKQSVAHFELTPSSLLKKVILPEQAAPILTEQLKQRLGMQSNDDAIAAFL
jgi:hypothetical protein